MDTIKKLTINESEYSLENGKKGKIAVFIYLGEADPKEVLDYAVQQYVGHDGYHELIDAHLNNPWMRVVISDINHMHQEPFDIKKHKLKTNKQL